jgi:hypothetical protein
VNPYLLLFNHPNNEGDVTIELTDHDAFAAIMRARRDNPDLAQWRVSAVNLASPTSCSVRT